MEKRRNKVKLGMGSKKRNLKQEIKEWEAKKMKLGSVKIRKMGIGSEKEILIITKNLLYQG